MTHQQEIINTLKDRIAELNKESKNIKTYSDNGDYRDGYDFAIKNEIDFLTKILISIEK